MIASLDGGATFARPIGGPGQCGRRAPVRAAAGYGRRHPGRCRHRAAPSIYGGVRFNADRAARRLRWGLPAEPPPIAVVTARGLDPLSPLFTDTVTPPIVITTRRRRRAVPTASRSSHRATIGSILAVAIDALPADGFRRVHCEGGPALLAALAAARPARRVLPDHRAAAARARGATPVLPGRSWSDGRRRGTVGGDRHRAPAATCSPGTETDRPVTIRRPSRRQRPRRAAAPDPGRGRTAAGRLHARAVGTAARWPPSATGPATEHGDGAVVRPARARADRRQTGRPDQLGAVQRRRCRRPGERSELHRRLRRCAGRPHRGQLHRPGDPCGQGARGRCRR